MAAPIQGLRVSLKFADSQDPVQILKNLNLEIGDLNQIRGISDQGVERADIRSLSGLTFDIEKQAVAIFNETRSYQNILSTLNDGRRRIGGNIDISGQIIAPTFKFRAVDFEDGNQIRTLDFSTSRASAWSAFGNPADSIFYGGDVLLTGNNATVELSSLEFVSSPIQKRFESQIPTHKFRVTIDGEDYDLYAMKGIPLKFRGFFRSVRNLRADFNILSNLRPSWIIRNLSNNQETIFQNRISGSGSNRQSIISVFSPSAAQREIEFYYPVDRITRIDLNGARIFELPSVTLPSLTTLNITDGDLIEMPNIASLYPTISSLNLSGNDLTRSDTTSLKTLSQDVVARLKTSGNTLRTLILDNTYANECTADFGDVTTGLPGLLTFRSDNSSSNSRRMRGTSPGIPDGMISYIIRGNNFTSLHPSVVQSTTLQTLDIRGNDIGGTIDTSGDNLSNIVTFITGGNAHRIVDMSNKTNLSTYFTHDSTFSATSNGRIGTNVFNGCTSLDRVRIHNTNVLGALPNFQTNTSLSFFASWASGWQDADANNSIAENTFGPLPNGGCRPTLEYFNLQSTNLRQPIHPNAFRNMPSLQTLVISSLGRGITGGYPESIDECFNLRELQIFSNQMTGEIPNFNGNRRLAVINLSRNNFSGGIPAISLPNLRSLLLQNNSFTSIGRLNCPNLRELNISFNALTNFPSLEECFRLQTIILNSNGNIRYLPGELESLTSLRRFEISNCGLTRGSIDRILIDLNENYNRNPRGNVVVNLTGNTSPSATEEIATIINRLRREGWTLGID